MTTLWRQVHGDLRDQITSGRLKPGQRLPSEAQLMAAHGIRGRGTIVRAVRELLGEGLVDERRRVRGHNPVEISLVRGADAWHDAMVALDRKPSEQIRVEHDGATVIRRVLRLADRQPYDLDRLMFAEDVAAGTPLMDRASIGKGVVAYLRDDLGWGPMRYRVKVGARMPVPDEMRDLNIPAGVPVLTEEGTATAGSLAVFWWLTVRPADRESLVLETED